jgi:hypothetical protein
MHARKATGTTALVDVYVVYPLRGYIAWEEKNRRKGEREREDRMK